MRNLRDVFYVKFARRNGHVSIFKEANTNMLKKFNSLAEAKEFAGLAISRLVNKRNTSPAAVAHIWVYKTQEAY